MTKNEQTKLFEIIRETVGLYRSFTLDAVEQEYGDLPNWITIRSRLLKLFGDRGLEGRLRSIIITKKDKQV